MREWTKTWAIVEDTLRESFARKILIAFPAITTLIILFFAFIMNIDVVDGAVAMVSIMGGGVQRAEVTKLIINVQSGLAVLVFTGGIFLSLFATGNFVPQMLERGTVDLLISKPLSRSKLLLAKYLGCLLIIALNVLYLVVGVWLVLSLKTGFWNAGFLYSALTMVGVFAILYCPVTLLGVTTRSPSVAIMVTYMIVFLSPLFAQREQLLRLLSNDVHKAILNGLYYILPKTFELGELTRSLVAGEPIENWMPVWSSLLFGAALLALATFLFARKDF